MSKRKEKKQNISHPRQKYLALVTSMDDYVAHIVQELKNNGLYDNSIIIFSSDNGGAPGHAGQWSTKGLSIWLKRKVFTIWPSALAPEVLF